MLSCRRYCSAVPGVKISSQNELTNKQKTNTQGNKKKRNNFVQFQVVTQLDLIETNLWSNVRGTYRRFSHRREDVLNL